MNAYTLRIGTRRSPLAMWQANFVAAQLQKNGVAVEVVPMQTLGDEVRSCAIPDIGAPGVFTRRLQEALLNCEIDLAVHSLKDLPTEHVAGLVLAAVPQREESGDVFVSPKAKSLGALPEGSVIGTGSVRRKTQIVYRYASRFVLRDIRGNIETRLKKLDDGEYDAIILAAAGLTRLGLGHRITERISPDILLSAVGQGALGIETREDDDTTRRSVATLNDRPTHAAVTAERAMLSRLQGGCIAPIAAHACLTERGLKLVGRLLTNDGLSMREASLTSSSDNITAAIELGIAVADELTRG
ncbi:MAG: hydroxymethylbilane synthase [Thermoguttaceae bacterium]